jgi:serine/threonine protein kinase
VYKKIRNDAERQDDMDRIMKEVKFLRERRHPNISPLLASFTAGLESSTNAEPMTKCLYLLAPQAEMDMEKWFNKEPSYIKTFESYESQDFNQHIYAAMRGLISGLTYIHRQLGFYVGYHGDLKPKNILKFESQSKLAWKISDFGTSNLKPVDDTRTQNIETTPYWAPKEFMAAITQREDGNHGRSHDVWSLGCIFLLLATMLVHKWEPEGLKAFEDLRAKDAKDPLDHAFCNRMPQVRQWIAELRKKKPRTDFGQLLDLIEEMLQPREARIFSWEAAVDLSSISDPSRTSDEIVEHLQQVVQAAREADLKLGQHNPLTRARSDKRKKARYLEILMENGWYDGLTTEEEKRVAMAKRSVSTLPTLESGDHVVGIETVLKKISERFKETDSLALSGLAGVGCVYLFCQ